MQGNIQSEKSKLSGYARRLRRRLSKAIDDTSDEIPDLEVLSAQAQEHRAIVEGIRTIEGSGMPEREVIICLRLLTAGQ